MCVKNRLRPNICCFFMHDQALLIYLQELSINVTFLDPLYKTILKGKQGTLLTFSTTISNYLKNLLFKNEFKKVDQKPYLIQFSRIVKTFHPCPMQKFLQVFRLLCTFWPRFAPVNQLHTFITGSLDQVFFLKPLFCQINVAYLVHACILRVVGLFSFDSGGTQRVYQYNFVYNKLYLHNNCLGKFVITDMLKYTTIIINYAAYVVS